jgi:hypothetical protein
MRTEVTLASRVRIHDDVVFRDLQGEAALLHLKTGVFFGLDAVGARIWHLVGEHRSLHGVVAALLEEFDVAEERCARDLLAFVVALRAHDLVRVEPPAAG